MRSIICKTEKGEEGEHHEYRHRIGYSKGYCLSEILRRDIRLTVILKFSERIGESHRNTYSHKHHSSCQQDEVLMLFYQTLGESQGKDSDRGIEGIHDTRTEA